MIIERQEDVTPAVLKELERAPNARFKEIMRAFITHMHDFVRDSKLTEEEYRTALNYVVALGKASGFTYVALDLEPRIYAHRTTSARFWLLTEKYRALLADVHDQAIEVAAITDRREALMQEARAIFEHAPPADRQTYEIAKAALTGGRKGYSEEEIDALLPESLRRPKGAPA